MSAQYGQGALSLRLVTNMFITRAGRGHGSTTRIPTGPVKLSLNIGLPWLSPVSVVDMECPMNSQHGWIHVLLNTLLWPSIIYCPMIPTQT
jgi:hypothetical protein